MPRLDLSTIPVGTGSSYPAPHDAAMVGRSQQRLGDAGGITQFGVNLVRLEPGALSALRHWHERQDEFLVVTEGALTLVDDSGETLLGPGDCCAFPAGEPNGHHVVNRSDAPGAFVVVGTRTATETGWYPDVDMKVTVSDGRMTYSRRDGAPLDGSADDPDFAVLSEALTRALLSGDFDAYRALHTLPHEVDPRGGKPYRIETEAALREDFDLYVRSLALHHVSDIFRVQRSAARPGPDTAEIEAEVHLLAGALRIVDPYAVRFTLAREGASWRIARTQSALGHINWTRGQGDLPESGRFET